MTIVKPVDDNITMVAFHGSKNRHPNLTRLIADTIQKIRSTTTELGLPHDFFKAYEDCQIHATIIGMEIIKIGDEIFNANFLNNNGKLRKTDPKRLLALLDAIGRSRNQNPLFTIRFGGFRKSYCKCRGLDLLDWRCVSSNSEFHSFARSAYEGSFYAFQKGPVMLTGWPVVESNRISSFNRDIYGFRRTASEFGFLDKYHLDEKPHWKDDDFYIRLGTFGECAIPEFESLIEKIRDFISTRKPITLDVELDDISIVFYEHSSLDKIKEKISIVDAIRTPSLVDDLYNRWNAEH